MTDDDRQKLEIDWLKTAAGALAAVSSAVILSTLGAAGTLIGAALGSVVATIGSALYTQGLARSRNRLAAAQTAARRKVGVAQAEVRRASRTDSDTAADAHLAYADERLSQAKQDLDDLEATVEEPDTWGQRLAGLPWKKVLLVAGGLFAVTVVAITVFELMAGQSVSQITGGTSDGGGTTVGEVGGGPSDARPKDDQTPTDAPTPTTEPSDTAAPTETPTPEQSESSTPTPTPSTSPTPTAPESPLTYAPTPTPSG